MRMYGIKTQNGINLPGLLILISFFFYYYDGGKGDEERKGTLVLLEFFPEKTDSLKRCLYFISSGIDVGHWDAASWIICITAVTFRTNICAAVGGISL